MHGCCRPRYDGGREPIWDVGRFAIDLIAHKLAIADERYQPMSWWRDHSVNIGCRPNQVQPMNMSRELFDDSPVKCRD